MKIVRRAIEVKYGDCCLKAKVPDNNYIELSNPSMNPNGFRTEEEIVIQALKNPIGSLPLRRIVGSGEKIAVVTSDITRPFPNSRVLPYLFDELKRGGADPENIRVIFALGSHRKHTNDEHKILLGSVYGSGIEFMDSDTNECRNLGTTVKGTPVDIFSPVLECDKIICLGNIEYHYFAGFSGGYKALMPGVSSLRAISHNHSLMTDERCKSGNLDGNPLRCDIDEFADFINMDFMLNVILNKGQNIIGAVAGHGIKAHREGCKLYDEMNGSAQHVKADIVIAAGGRPKDDSLYQAQKYLEAAWAHVNPGGVIIWCAEAREGFGNDIFEEWITEFTADQIIDKIKSNFVLGGHKAAYIAKVLKNHRIIAVSDLEGGLLEKIGMIPAESLDDALKKAFEFKGGKASIVLFSA